LREEKEEKATTATEEDVLLISNINYHDKLHNYEMLRVYSDNQIGEALTIGF